jgi:hypothetical protein
LSAALGKMRAGRRSLWAGRKRLWAGTSRDSSRKFHLFI